MRKVVQNKTTKSLQNRKWCLNMDNRISKMMELKNQLTERLEECNNKIVDLPKGTIHSRVLDGKTNYYRSYREGGKSKSDYIKPGEVEEWKRKTQLHKTLKEEIKLLEADLKLLDVLTNSSKKFHSSYWSVIDFMERRLN